MISAYLGLDGRIAKLKNEIMGLLFYEDVVNESAYTNSMRA